MLEPGDEAPEVRALNQHGETVAPDFTTTTVVYFYPRDATRGCTIEANDFQSRLPEFHERGVTVYGVSTDDAESHADFADAEGLEFDLLADPDGEIAGAFGVPVSGGAAGRHTFVLADGEVRAVYESVDPNGHASDVLNDVRSESR